MPQYIQQWTWQEAFSKFGFGDGDAWIGTYLVANFLSDEGYEVDYDRWGIHNTVISKLSKNGISLLPDRSLHGVPIEASYFETKQIMYGYDDPETYLPADLVKKLNKQFHDNFTSFF